MTQPMIEVRNLKQYYNAGTAREMRAVDDVSFQIYPGETFGLVGESGSGKSTIGRAIVNLLQPTSGDVIFQGQSAKDRQTTKERLAFNKEVQMIFQDPYASLNPRMKVRDIIAEGIDVHGLATNRQERRQRVNDLLDAVGLNIEHGDRYPHEFSGGQRQRIGIARALAVEPKFIVCDEPISALDVSIQAQVINLLEKLQQDRGLTYLFIAHDLSMVKYFSDRIGMMYRGKLVELATSDELYANPLHPYTQSLLSAIPLPDPDYEKTRKRSIYMPPADFQLQKQNFNEVRAGHWVLEVEQ
ncbi:ATP-binding cassette domain-containing protein [Aerococcaceae bacterium NML191292]|nr:ATP-binding cassette domain-containing protein [Aerococcaceae bacterium NML191292]MCW6661673.1 ATP-binding cassette domain-containing protein [Aerococcaceae bacterium NML201209]MCW6663892.1 ATP-binding cassette domain-containing protein [Aerococcaceae bacterium NML190073]MCW6665165.1 ATP-binding cassette domain-containing protein [Aerococcaceae bacterium NML191219]MCW6667486.1 ATP-binding cassette domain-containing protein [Aerococcaceae bacterium NML190938]